MIFGILVLLACVALLLQPPSWIFLTIMTIMDLWIILFKKRTIFADEGGYNYTTIFILITLFFLYCTVQDLQREEYLNPFVSELEEYNNLSNISNIHENIQSPYIKGKVITIDTRSNSFDYILFLLNKDVRATKPEEVGTVVGTNCFEFEVGHYIGRGGAYRYNCDIYIVDKEKKFIIDKKTFLGSEPPFSTSGTSEHGAKPISEMVDYIDNLPRK
jgi:hypothetical protein